jgi:hypothetical protein
VLSAGAPAGGSQPSAPFVDAAADVGLVFVHDNGGTGQLALPEIMGSGAALFDYDDDGDLDAYLVQSGPLERAARPHSGSRLFRNDLRKDGSRLRFTDVTGSAGVTLTSYGMGAAVGDVDGDGDLDLYVTAFGSNTLFRNNADGTFTDVTQQAGVDDPRWSTSAAFVDYDRDGDLDLYVGNYVAFTMGANKVCTDPAGARDYCAPAAWPPVPDRLFRNDGAGTFSDASESAGISRAYGPALGVAVGDFDADGWPDIYVANDARANQLWRNRRDGTFEDLGLLSGTAVNAGGRPEGSMGIALGDPDNDGDEDLFVTNLIGETHVFYANDGAGNFEDARTRTGTTAATAPMTGFGAGWFDYDHDGWLDLFLANGAVNIVEAQRGQPLPFRQRNQLFRNEGYGRLRDRTADAGPAFERQEVSRGAAFGDVDNDGDVDVLVTNNHGSVRLLLNQRVDAPGSAAPMHWVQLALRSRGPNRRAVGARVGVHREGAAAQWRRVRTDGSYLSASDERVHVGLGSGGNISRVTVEWPDGSAETFTGIAADRIATLTQGQGRRDRSAR